MTEIPDPSKKRLMQAYIDTVRATRPRIGKIWKARRRFLVVNGIVVVVTLILLLFVFKPYFVSTINLLPDYGANSSSSSLSGIASLVTGGTGTPAEIYQTLLMSETVTRPVLEAKRITLASKD